MTVTVNVIGARDGQGTSTTAAALALLAARRDHRVELITDTPDTMRALLGLPDAQADTDAIEVVPGLTLRTEPSGAASMVIGDTGTLESRSDDEKRTQVAVLRGPCYLSLRATVDLVRRGIDAIVIVREPGRSLTRQDVAAITGLDIVAETHTTPRVARAIDAGVLPTIIGRLDEFAPLERWLDTLPVAVAAPLATVITPPHPVRPSPVRFERSRSDTDLPLPLSSGSGRGLARSSGARYNPLARSAERTGGQVAIPVHLRSSVGRGVERMLRTRASTGAAGAIAQTNHETRASPSVASTSAHLRDRALFEHRRQRAFDGLVDVSLHPRLATGLQTPSTGVCTARLHQALRAAADGPFRSESRLATSRLGDSPDSFSAMRAAVLLFVCTAFVGCSSSSATSANTSPSKATSPPTVPARAGSLTAGLASGAHPLEPWRITLAGKLEDGRTWQQRVAKGSDGTVCSSFDLDGSATQADPTNRSMPAEFFYDGFIYSCDTTDASDPIVVMSSQLQISPLSNGSAGSQVGYISGVTLRPATSMQALGKVRFTKIDQEGDAFVWWFHRLPAAVRVEVPGLSADCLLTPRPEPIGTCTILGS